MNNEIPKENTICLLGIDRESLQDFLDYIGMNFSNVVNDGGENDKNRIATNTELLAKAKYFLEEYKEMMNHMCKVKVVKENND